MEGDTMKSLIITVFLIFTLCSCITPTFTVKEADSRFDANKDRFFTSDGNRISSKSVAGGLLIDTSGLYINPFVSKDSTGKISTLGLYIYNDTNYDTKYGAPNTLGYIELITFRLAGGSLIDLRVVDQDVKHDDVGYYNKVSRSFSLSILETGRAYITKEQFRQIATAKHISCKVYGSELAATFETKDISKAFLVNLNQFYQMYVK